MPRVPFDPATDYYQLLGVQPGASPEEIQAAYRRLAKVHHPDLHAGSAVAAARMARVNVAKSVLLDRDTRASYDQLRAARRSAARVAARPAPVSRPGVRYFVPQPVGAHAATAPRYRVVAYGDSRRGARTGSMDRQTGVLLLLIVPLLAALVLYVVQAMQVSTQPLRASPSDLALAPAGAFNATGRPTARGTADAVFMMVHGQPANRPLGQRAFNLIMSRSDSTPESETLRAVGRRLVQAGAAGDLEAWQEATSEICVLASRC